MEEPRSDFYIVQARDDKPMPIIRTSMEALRHDFVEAYEAWVKSEGSYDHKEELWRAYCLARDRFVRLKV